MLFKHSFRTSHAEVVWQIERVPILAEDLTMTVSALNVILDCLFLCVLNSMFLKEKCKKKKKKKMFYYSKI